MEEEVATKIKSFTQLKAWQEGHTLVVRTYKEVRAFPKSELFGLVNQMQRSAVSITSNLAEGFGRKTLPDKAHFYTIAHGSTTELQNQLLIARDVGYLNSETFHTLATQSVLVSKLINGLLRSLKRQ